MIILGGRETSEQPLTSMWGRIQMERKNHKEETHNITHLVKTKYDYYPNELSYSPDLFLFVWLLIDRSCFSSLLFVDTQFAMLLIHRQFPMRSARVGLTEGGSWKEQHDDFQIGHESQRLRSHFRQIVQGPWDAPLILPQASDCKHPQALSS